MQIQNRGTLAGNICTASPAGDGVPNLLALDAQRRAGERAGPPRRADRASSSTAIAAPHCRADEIVTALLVPKPRRARAQPFPQARRAALSGHLDRHGGGRHRDGRRRQDRRGAASRSARARGAAAPAGAGGGAWPASRSRRPPTSSRRRDLAPPLADRRHPRLRRLSRGRRRWRWSATCWRAGRALRRRAA